MSFDLVITEYGPPALRALAGAVRQAKADEPLTPVTVVVPSNHVGVTARRQLATDAAGPLTSRGTGTIGITFLTPYRLAELYGAARLAASGRRPVSTPVIAAALRTALRDDPGVFAPVADHPATEEALVASYNELSDLSAAALDALAGASPRASDVVRLFRATRSKLAAGWYDESDLAAAARSVVDTTLEDAPGEAAGLGHLIVYLPQDLTRRAAALLRAAARPGAATVIAGLTGGEAADRGVRRSLGRLGISSEEGPGPGPPPGWPVSASATRVVTTSDADEEVRVAVQTIIDAARDGVPLDRMAVLFPTREPYARLSHEHLVSAGIPANGTAVRGLAERTYGRAMVHLLALRDRNYRRHDVLDLLTGAPVRLRGGAPAPTARWERLSREAGIVGGRPEWDDRLTHLADHYDRRADDVAPGSAPEERDESAQRDEEQRQIREGHYRRRAEQVRELRQLVLGLIDDIEAAAARPRSWHERVRWLRRVTGQLLGGEATRQRWPEDERRAATRVEAALDRLDAVDEIDGDCTLEVFRRSLELELEADLGRVGRLGDGVLLAPLSFGIGLDLSLVVVVGAAEGALPARLLDDSLLPDRERAAANAELPLRREQADRQQRQLHAALAAARSQVLVAPRGDLRASSNRSTSRWLEEITAGGADATPVPRRDEPSFAYRVRHATFPATEQEHRLRSLGLAGGSGPRDPSGTDDPVVKAGRELVTARHSTRFTRFDGNLAGLPVRSPADEVVSATRLESWANCPHAYFMRHVLRVEPVEDPAESLWISPLDKGSLIHEVLERFFRRVLESPEGPPAPDDRWTDEHHAGMQQVALDVCAEYEARGVVGRPLFWRRDRDRLLALLDRFLLDDDRQRRARGSRPLAAEMAFGLPGAELPAVEVPIAGDRRLRFRGSADRVDVCDDGAFRVIDYKTGRPYGYLALSEQNPDDHGTRLQLAVYGVAARVHHGPAAGAKGSGDLAEYWFIGENERLRAIGYPVTGDVFDRVGATLASIVDGIAAGVFPARPTASASDPFVRCRYCDPDGLGVADRRREWERKRNDPALAGYVRLAEPGPEDEEQAGGGAGAGNEGREEVPA